MFKLIHAEQGMLSCLIFHLPNLFINLFRSTLWSYVISCLCHVGDLYRRLFHYKNGDTLSKSICHRPLDSVVCFQKGFSSIEVLIALLIFSVGLLGIAKVQMLNNQAAYDALNYFHANMIVNSIYEHQVASQTLFDQSFWARVAESSLPNGEVDIGQNSVRIAWQAVDPSSLETSDNALRTVSLEW